VGGKRKVELRLILMSEDAQKLSRSKANLFNNLEKVIVWEAKARRVGYLW